MPQEFRQNKSFIIHSIEYEANVNTLQTHYISATWHIVLNQLPWQSNFSPDSMPQTALGK